MENINLIDGASFIIIFLSSSLAYFRGLSREILAIMSWILAALIAFILAPVINPALNGVPVVKEILAESCQLSILIAFVLGFILTLILFSVFIPFITNIIQRSNLSGIDRFLGLCFGALRGLLVLIIVMIGYDLFFTDETGLAVVENSRTSEIIFSVKEDLKELMPKTKPSWIMGRFDKLMATCDAGV